MNVSTAERRRESGKLRRDAETIEQRKPGFVASSDFILTTSCIRYIFTYNIHYDHVHTCISHSAVLVPFPGQVLLKYSA